MTEDEMVVWHQQLNGHEFEQTLGDSEGQGIWIGMLHFMGSQRVRHDGVTKTFTFRSLKQEDIQTQNTEVSVHPHTPHS